MTKIQYLLDDALCFNLFLRDIASLDHCFCGTEMQDLRSPPETKSPPWSPVIHSFIHSTYALLKFPPEPFPPFTSDIAKDDFLEQSFRFY